MQNYSAKNRYRGDVAANYEKIRKDTYRNQKRWDAEFSCLDKLLSGIREGSSFLDIPCGTGRFFPVLFKHGVKTVGVDISEEMIRQIPVELLSNSNLISVQTGDAEFLDFPDLYFDYVMCMRFFNIVPVGVRLNSLKEFKRVSSKGIFIQIRFQGLRMPLSNFIHYAGKSFRKAKNKIREVINYHCIYDVSENEDINRPTIREFRKLVQDLDLSIVNIYPIPWGPTINPMTICHLKTNH